LHDRDFPNNVTAPGSILNCGHFSMTILALVALVALASSVVALLVALVIRRATARATASVDLSGISVSRQWLIQHQSNDRP
jgi:uncharacterized membrane protein